MAKTNVDTEILVIRRIRKELEDLPSTTARMRALAYVMDVLREDSIGPTYAQGTPPPPVDPRQLPIPGTDTQTEEADLFPEANGG